MKQAPALSELFAKHASLNALLNTELNPETATYERFPFFKANKFNGKSRGDLEKKSILFSRINKGLFTEEITLHLQAEADTKINLAVIDEIRHALASTPMLKCSNTRFMTETLTTFEQLSNATTRFHENALSHIIATYIRAYPDEGNTHYKTIAKKITSELDEKLDTLEAFSCREEPATLEELSTLLLDHITAYNQNIKARYDLYIQRASLLGTFLRAQGQCENAPNHSKSNAAHARHRLPLIRKDIEAVRFPAERLGMLETAVSGFNQRLRQEREAALTDTDRPEPFAH